MESTISGFKAFNPDWKCRDFQFEVGKTFEYAGTVKPCNSCFHFCTNPFDLFSYFPPASKFAEVEGEGAVAHDEDSKHAAKRLTIKAEVSLSHLLGIGVKLMLAKIDWKNAKESNTGDRSAATNTGEEGCAISLGIKGKASGALGCWLTIAEWKQAENYNWHRVDVKTKRVDGKKIKADIFYQLVDGKFVEAQS